MEKIKRKKLPIGISNFKEIIENNYYYVDKTNFIENILVRILVFGSEISL